MTKLLSTQKAFLKKLSAFLLFALLSLLLVLALPNTTYAQVENGARCRCANPVSDGCACQVTSGGSVTVNEGGVDVVCDPEVAGNYWARANPICGFNAEVVPYCAPSSGNSGSLFCWGTNWSGSISPDVPLNSQSWVPLPGGTGTVSFNGGSWNDIKEIWTCAADLYCCGPASKCDGSGQIEYGTCPSSGPPLPDTPAFEACENLAVGNLAGIGESRIWVSQDRLVSALSLMAQTMFNPYGLNELYENTAFSKNSDQVDRNNDTSGNIDNLSGVTTRVRRHQGIDDATQVVNTTSNNSSVIVGMGAPPPLDPYYTEFQDRSCYVADTFQNPGDDLIGPKIRGEMLFTEQFTYEAKGRPDGCTDDGGSWTFEGTAAEWEVAKGEECKENCCSDICVTESWTNPCVAPFQDPFGVESCPPVGPDFSAYQEPCTTQGGTTWCCADVEGTDQWCEQTTTEISCSRPPKATIPVGADANIFDKTPIIESIYDTILDGTDSLFRRFFPLPENEKYEFDDIPTKSLFGASVSPANFGTQAGGFNLKFAGGQVGAPELYFPHLGDLHQYWLQDLQKALRPEGTVVEYEVSCTSDMKNIGIFTSGGGEATNYISQVNPNMVVVYNDYTFSDQIPESTLVVARPASDLTSKSDLTNLMTTYSNVDVWQPYNEPLFGGKDLTWLTTQDLQTIDAGSETGKDVCIGNFHEGLPDDAMLASSEFQTYAQAVKSRASVSGITVYLCVNEHENADNWEFGKRYNGRFTKITDILDLPVLVTVAGYDSAAGPSASSGEGWQGNVDEETYLNMLFEYQLAARNAGAQGVAVFQVGLGGEWEPFDISPLLELTKKCEEQ